jgi:hypothetical protein
MFGNIKKFLRNFNLKENNRPLIFLVSLMIATVLWLVNAMEKQYVTTISMPFQYTNLPRNKVLVNPPPSRLNVKLRANGFTLLRLKFGLTFTPLIFDVNLINEESKEKIKSTDFYVLSDRYISQISNQVNPEISVLDISPDSLFFHFDKLSEKRVKITANINVSFQNHYYYCDSLILSPKEIIVRGPSSIVDTLTSVYTKIQKFNNLNITVKQNIALEKIDNLEFSTYKTYLKIPVSNQSTKKKI